MSGNSALITGEPGTGKSWLLDLLAHTIAVDFSDTGRIPVLLPARYLDHQHSSFIQGIKKNIEISLPGVSETDIGHFLRKGRFILLIDALDEAEPYLNSLIEKIVNLKNQSPDTQLFCTSREGFSSPQLETLLSHYKLELLTDSQIKHYISSLNINWPNFYLQTKVLSSDLLRIPLMLHMVSTIFQQRPTQFHHTSILSIYVDYCEHLFNWQRNKGHHFIDKETLDKILEEYAFQTFRKQPSQSLLDNIIYQNSVPALFDSNRAGIAHSGLLLNQLNPTFSHQTFQEFFLAKWVARSADDNFQLFISEYSPNPANNEVFKFLVGLVDLNRQDILLNHLESSNFSLLAQCLSVLKPNKNPDPQAGFQINSDRDLPRLHESYIRIIDNQFRNLKEFFHPWDTVDSEMIEKAGCPISDFGAILEAKIFSGPRPMLHYRWVPVNPLEQPSSGVKPWYPDPYFRGTQTFVEITRFKDDWIHFHTFDNITKTLKSLINEKALIVAEDHYLAAEFLLNLLKKMKQNVLNFETCSISEPVHILLERLKPHQDEFYPDHPVQIPINQAIYYLLRFHHYGLKPIDFLLPQPDQDLMSPLHHFNKHPDELACLRLRKFYDIFQLTYRNLVENAFPKLKEIFPLYKLGPVRFLVKYNPNGHYSNDDVLSRLFPQPYQSYQVGWEPVFDLKDAQTQIELVQDFPPDDWDTTLREYAERSRKLLAHNRDPKMSFGWDTRSGSVDEVFTDNALRDNVYQQIQHDLEKILNF